MKKLEKRNTGFSEQSQKLKPSIGINYLLVIAIDQYQHVTPLDNAVRDAKAFQQILWENYQFDKQHTVSLFDAKANKDDILDKFDFLTDTLTENDSLILYFAGHGELIKNHGYWILYYGKLNKRGTYLPNSLVINFFENLKARHIFAIVDSCFSATLFKTRKLSVTEKRLEIIPSRWLLTSGMEEPVLDGTPGQHSPFAKTLITQLQAHKGSGISVTRLSANIQEVVPHNSHQTPRWEPLQKVDHQGGQFIFHPKDATDISSVPIEIIKDDYDQLSQHRHEDLQGKQKNNLILIGVILGILLLGVAVWSFIWNVNNGNNISQKNQKFDLVSYIYTDKSMSERAKNISLNVEYLDTSLKIKTDQTGKLLLDKIPNRLRGDSIYFSPISLGFNKKRIAQVIPKNIDSLSFYLEPEIHLKGRVLKLNGLDPIENATVLVDENYKTTTSKSGYFELFLPFKEGVRKPILIKNHHGKTIYFNDNELLSGKNEKEIIE